MSCPADIVLNGYNFTKGSQIFVVRPELKVDKDGNEINSSATNVEYTISHTSGIILKSITVTEGTSYDDITKVWTIPSVSRDNPVMLTYIAEVTDETLVPYNVTLTLTSGPDAPNTAPATYSQTLDGITKAKIEAILTAAAKGDSAYQIWLDEGNVGSEADFLLDITGPQGNIGNTGATPTIQMGLVTTLPPGSAVTAVFNPIGGDVYVLNLGIPQGDDGASTAASQAWADITGKPVFVAVATSGDYGDLINTPAIPANTSDLVNDSGFVTSDTTRSDTEIYNLIEAMLNHLNHSNITSSRVGDEIRLVGSGGAADGNDYIVTIERGDGSNGGTINDLVFINNDPGTSPAANVVIADVFLDTDTNTQNTYTFTRPGGTDNLEIRENGVLIDTISVQAIAPAAHTHSPSEVGLGSVDNTSDLNKPISTATQTALDNKIPEAPNNSNTYARSGEAWVIQNQNSIDRIAMSQTLVVDLDGVAKTADEITMYFPKTSGMSGYVLTEVGLFATNSINGSVANIDNDSSACSFTGITASTTTTETTITPAENDSTNGYYVTVADTGSNPGVTIISATLYFEKTLSLT